ncbi:MAG: Flp pilus assembly complex ATPase component TadA [Acidobacteria bacterium]|nr:Flp pilus assembly complex ATPase component TadA [Acidobacteriota bacterium]
MSKKRFGELLVDAGLLSTDDVARVLQEQKGRRERTGETVVRLGLASEAQIARALASQLGIAVVDLSCMAIEPDAVQLVPERLARKHQVMPVTLQSRELKLAMADPLKFEALQDIRFAVNCTIVPVLATVSDIRKAIDQYYHLGDSLDALVRDMVGDRAIEVLPDRLEHDAKDSDDLRKRSEAAPIVRMVNMIISQAVDAGASDIHIEPGRTAVSIRNRVDGLLRQSLDAPKWVQAPVISRIKVMARMDIAEKRLPQDGRVAVRVGGRSLDLRVSVVPGANGEKVVIRILDSASVTAPVESMGLEPSDLARLHALIARPQGIVLVTGPTGAGKTSTLYAMLNSLRSIERNIMTIEDPIEYELAGVNQTAVQDRIGLTFPAMLRALLRQDPDVIMVGEMRDLETTSIAIQASITGHLVLSTMHTNSAAATVTRLRNLGVPSFLIASAVNGIVAQRLVRRICPDCRVPADPSEADVARLGRLVNLSRLQAFRGEGCASCNGAGYRGRTGVFEILAFTPEIRDMVAAGGHESDLRRRATALGTRSLLTAGLDKVRAGHTTLSELFRVIDVTEETGAECPACGEGVEARFLGCPACGHRFGRTCPGCRERVQTDWQMCPHCCTSLGTPERHPRRAATLEPVAR